LQKQTDRITKEEQ